MCRSIEFDLLPPPHDSWLLQGFYNQDITQDPGRKYFIVAKLQLLQERAELQYRNLMYTVLGGVIHTNIQTETVRNMNSQEEVTREIFNFLFKFTDFYDTD